MPHDLFYAPPSRISGTDIIIDGEELQHLAHAMRRKPGDTILVADGSGSLYEVIIRTLTRTAAACTIVTRRRSEVENVVPVTLGAGVMKNPARFDFLVEKATELGAAAIVPLATARTISRHAREDRWQKLALAAMKQSGRAVLPRVAPLTPFADFLRSCPADALRLCAHDQTAAPMTRFLAHHGRSSIILCVGPEGGFTDEEILQAVAAGFLLASLGPRRLRTETAAMVATALCTLAADPLSSTAALPGRG